MGLEGSQPRPQHCGRGRALTCGGNSPSFPTWAGADEASSPAQEAIRRVGTQRPPRHRGHPKRSEPGPRGGPDTECSPALRSLFSPPPGLALTAPAVLKATEPHFAAADFCPEPRRCRLRAGSLTPRAGRQRATAASAFRWPREPRRCRCGLGASTSTWAALELTPWLPAAVPWALLLALQRQKGVWAASQGTNRCVPVGTGRGGLG